MKCSTARVTCVFLVEGTRDCNAIKVCRPIVIECETASLSNPCSRIITNEDISYCSAYINPGQKWANTNKCPLRQERKREDEESKKKVNPLKASKQKWKGGSNK